MSLVEIIAVVIAVLMLISRFVPAWMKAWSSIPTWIAVLLPPAIILCWPVLDVFRHVKNWHDIIVWLIAALILAVVGLFVPNDGPPPEAPPPPPPTP